MTVDLKGFDVEMAAQKERARAAAAVEAADWVVVNEGEPEFIGYDNTEADVKILRYLHVKQKNREYYQLILSETPFYAEMGGQVGDRGTLTDSTTGAVTEIYDTKRENGVGVHLVKHLPADVNATFHAAIDKENRMAISRNHTATHLLHQALREVLGSHVEQKGSLVTADGLRFDFSHFQKVTPEELRKVERLANRRVREAYALDEHRHMPIAEAKAMGAMALFGEKYGDDVRVVRYGDSIELCGGTHVANSGNIGMIRILSESSIAAGIRRIEAVTGTGVEDLLDHAEDTVKSISAMFNNAPDLLGALRKAIDENAELRKQAEEYMKERIAAQASLLLEKAVVTENGTKIVGRQGVAMPDVIKGIAFAVRELSPEGTAFIAATRDAAGKPLLTVMLTEDLAKSGLNASQIVREAARSIKGGGGGQPGFAQAGGKDAEGLSVAFEAMINAIKH